MVIRSEAHGPSHISDGSFGGDLGRDRRDQQAEVAASIPAELAVMTWPRATTSPRRTRLDDERVKTSGRPFACAQSQPCDYSHGPKMVSAAADQETTNSCTFKSAELEDDVHFTSPFGILSGTTSNVVLDATPASLAPCAPLRCEGRIPSGLLKDAASSSRAARPICLCVRRPCPWLLPVLELSSPAGGCSFAHRR